MPASPRQDVPLNQAPSPGRYPASYTPFHPRPWLSNGHLQTIFGNFLRRADTLPEPVAQLVEVSPARNRQIASQILCHCHWQPLPERPERPTVIILHGLEGSSRSQYVVGNANKLWRAGANVIRMNMRNCGGTERLTPTLYHSGLSSDVNHVLHFFRDSQRLQSISLIGYSMGGNLMLKLAGDLGAEAPPELRSVIGVSPAIDLGASADALHEWQTASTNDAFCAPCSSVSGARPLFSRTCSTPTAPPALRPCARSTTASLRSTPAFVQPMSITTALRRRACWTASPSRRLSCIHSMTLLCASPRKLAHP